MNVVNLDDIKHGIRVANYSNAIAKEIKLTKRKTDNLYISALFHDIGKAHVNQTVLNKPSKLTPKERIQISQHPIFSYEEILNIGYSKEIALNILHHHENFDGTGYPNGLIGTSIPIGARILRITDVFDALTMERPYRKKLSIDEALLIMNKEIQVYDQELFSIFIKYIQSKYKDDLIKENHVKDTKITLSINHEFNNEWRMTNEL